MTTMTYMALVFVILVGSFRGETASINVQETAATQTTDAPHPDYYGCFDGSDTFPPFERSLLDPQNDNIKCQKTCLDDGYMFSATHGEFCGCSKMHPSREFSGPKHKGATSKVPNVHGHKCNKACPGNPNGGQCQGMEHHCCGGPEAYTVYIVGGLKNCRTSYLRELEKLKVNFTASHIPKVCLPEDAKKRDRTSVLPKINKQLDDNTSGAKRDEIHPGCSKEDAKHAISYGFHACCSPCCDWLLDYMEIDGTVVKCI